MTVIDDRPVACRNTPMRAARPAVRPSPARPAVRPAPARPAVPQMRYRGRGIPVSAAPHGPRPVRTSVAIALAGLAALITLWLGALAQFSGVHASAPAHPDRLAVVVVQAGENLYQLAGRVAPDVPAAEVVERIRGLNNLESSAIGAGQTLIAPVG